MPTPGPRPTKPHPKVIVVDELTGGTKHFQYFVRQFCIMMGLDGVSHEAQDELVSMFGESIKQMLKEILAIMVLGEKLDEDRFNFGDKSDNTMVSRKEVMKRFGVTQQNIYQHESRGVLKAYDVHGNRLPPSSKKTKFYKLKDVKNMGAKKYA